MNGLFRTFACRDRCKQRQRVGGNRFCRGCPWGNWLCFGGWGRVRPRPERRASVLSRSVNGWRRQWRYFGDGAPWPGKGLESLERVVGVVRERDLRLYRMRQLVKKAGRERAVSIQDRTSRACSLPDRLRIIRSDQNVCDPTLNSLASLSTQERRKSADPKSLHENRREPASN